MVIFQSIIAWFAAFGIFIAGVFTGTGHNDLMSSYKKAVNSVDFYENDFETALPQTCIYSMISDFLSTPSQGGKEKKVIVIGYDGCRADNLSMCKDNTESGILTLLQNGGHAKLSYCGGVNYPAINKQDTSTAPGWCSMLTGKWASETGVIGNDIVKSNDYLTLLTTLVEDNTIESSAFYVSWGGHFSNQDSTYHDEKLYCEQNQINATFLRASDDNGTYDNVIADITKSDCSDFIFSIFEYCDHIGHDTGFCKNNPDQVQAFKDQESTSKLIIDQIKSRPTYSNEDWFIIITSDHGGVNTWHGGPTIQERYTFIVSNKEI